MSIDLHSALHDAARSSAATAPGFGAGPVLGRIHRRRRRRATAQGTVGVAAVGAVALGFLPGSDDGELWPAAAAPEGEVACGEPMPDVSTPDGVENLRIEDATLGPAIFAGSVHVTASFVVGDLAGLPEHLRPEPVGIIVDGRGVVVGGTELDRLGDDATDTVDALEYGPVAGGTTVPLTADVGLNRCDVVGTSPQPLHGGTYSLYLAQVLGTADGTGDEMTVVGGPWPLTIVTEATLRGDA